MSIRVLDVEVCSKELTLYQRLVGDVSCVVWDAAIVLSKYLQLLIEPNGECSLIGRKVLELGAGVGCVGLTAATLGAEVTLTDLPEALPLLKHNIVENKSTLVSQGGFATVEALSWGDVESDVIKNTAFDYVLLADCVYYTESIDPLINTLKSVNQNASKKPCIILSQELRDSEIQMGLWNMFFQKLKKDFNIAKIDSSEQHSEYSSDDILILHCTLKS
ncbi:protein N-lysine methyltransferase METTL21D-like [Arctopsyche grandis]|uniref:protein N-lysine methyltransferase METTL21D-like n=1 Tax=Arctopsyche grandis TaxID=121162 RepID=UPI00406D6D63